MLAPWKKSYDKPRQHIKKQRYHSDKKGPYRQIYGFSSSYVWMWELDQKEGWAPKNWCFQTVVLEKTLESPVDCKVIKSVNPIGNKSWILTGRSDAEAEAPIICSPDVKNQPTGKDPDAREDWGQDEKKVTEDEMVEWHHWLNGHEFEQTLGDSEGQGSLVCCSPWGRKESTRLSGWTTYIIPSSPASLLSLYLICLGHHRAPEWVPCATQQLPTSCPSYTR